MHVELKWAAVDPQIVIDESANPISVSVDPRLSRAQVEAACAELDVMGDEILTHWQGLVGISPDSRETAR